MVERAPTFNRRKGNQSGRRRSCTPRFVVNASLESSVGHGGDDGIVMASARVGERRGRVGDAGPGGPRGAAQLAGQRLGGKAMQ